MKKLLLLFLLLAFAVPANAFNPLLVCTGAVASGGTSCSTSTDYIGNKTYEAYFAPLSEDRMYCIEYSPTCTSGCTEGTFDTALVRHVRTATENVKMLIYIDDGDSVPDSGDSLVSTSAEITSSTNEENASGSISGTATCGSSYFVCLVSDSTEWYAPRQETGATTTYYQTISSSYDSSPSNLDGSWGSVTRELSMYATVGP
jgi:hypothetical protein